jgi:hypothetical protein
VPRLTSMFGGHLEFASIRLDDAIINVVKTGGPSEPGRWNFEPLLNRSVIRAIPELHVRSGRINFKFGDTKSVFYLTNTDLDIAPPSHGAATWSVDFTGEPARTDKPAHGFGEFIARGRWTQSGAGRLDLDVRLEKSEIGEIVAASARLRCRHSWYRCRADAYGRATRRYPHLRQSGRARMCTAGIACRRTGRTGRCGWRGGSTCRRRRLKWNPARRAAKRCRWPYDFVVPIISRSRIGVWLSIGIVSQPAPCWIWRATWARICRPI